MLVPIAGFFVTYVAATAVGKTFPQYETVVQVAHLGFFSAWATIFLI